MDFGGWDALPVACSPRCLSIRLTEMLPKWPLPWRNYILSRSAAVTGLSPNTRGRSLRILCSGNSRVSLVCFLLSKKKGGAVALKISWPPAEICRLSSLQPISWCPERGTHYWGTTTLDVVSRRSVVEMLWGFGNPRNLKLTWGWGGRGKAGRHC